jgi:hypothetical protein
MFNSACYRFKKKMVYIKQFKKSGQNIGGYQGGYTGDGGQATDALLMTPLGIAFDRALNNLYISDYGNNCLRKVSQAGIITTLICMYISLFSYTCFSE